jgi:pimeloyl-ACP methyl ester carboxylesterase
LRKSLAVFPLRVQTVTTLLPFPGARRYQSPSGEIGYWFRPHTAKNTRPVVFIHGIGVGLWPYTRFLNEIGRPTGAKTGTIDADEGEIGVIALEILPISTRLTSPPLRREAFLSALQTILSAHAADWGDDGFVLVSHSYGSVLTTHVVRSPDLGPQVRGVVLIDPVSLLLHLPGVAYNFTRRPPQTANEWQLWFFASMDVGVAEGLGRHFFWRENEVWKEELVGQGPGAPKNGKRQVAVCLGGRDLIVDTHTVAKYLARRGDIRNSDKSEEDAVEALYGRRQGSTLIIPKRQQCKKYLAPSGVEILWFPTLDHAQVFDSLEDREQVLGVIREYCTI